jgi:Trp operon repressor
MSPDFIQSLTAQSDKATRDLHRSNSEQALQAIIELMLTDHSTEEVVARLRGWADYLDDRH